MIGLPRTGTLPGPSLDGADPTQFYLREPPYAFTEAGESASPAHPALCPQGGAAISRQRDEW